VPLPRRDQPSGRFPVVQSMAGDSALVEKALAGDRHSFELLVEKYYKVLFNGALRMVNDTEDARDIVQVTFLKAYEKLHTFKLEQKFFSWIYRIMFHESLNLLHRRKPRVDLPPTLEEPASNPEEAYAENELSVAISRALQSLSHDNRLVVVLRHFLGLSYDEMSEILDIPEKTVKSRLFTARRQLGVLLADRRATT